MNTEKYLINEQEYNHITTHNGEVENIIVDTANDIFVKIFEAFDKAIDENPDDDIYKLIVMNWNHIATEANYYDATIAVKYMIDMMIAKFWYFGDIYLNLCRENYINEKGISSGKIDEAW